ncbi:MAG: hypothetical protein WBM64_15650 [Woeseiaceae bacterium]
MSAQAESFSPTIKAVHEITTGYVEQHKEHRYGSAKPLMWWVLTSRSWVRAPITAYAIEHRDGLVLFDTGMDPGTPLSFRIRTTFHRRLDDSC